MSTSREGSFRLRHAVKGCKVVLSIRKVEPHDAGECTDLAAQMHAASKYAYIPFNRDRVMMFIRFGMDGATRQGFVAVTEDNTIVGFLGMYIETLFFADIKSAFDIAMFVHPEHRQPAVASGLVTLATAWAKEQGAQRIVMSVTAPENTQRVGKLYQRYGFQQCGEYYSKEII